MYQHRSSIRSEGGDVIGLYAYTPENAVVLCVDEKPAIQALERAQGVEATQWKGASWVKQFCFKGLLT